MDLSSSIADSTDTALCPWESRRSSKEVWVKFFVVHLTTIAAFCHVLSVSREPVISCKLLFYVLVPYGLLAQHGLFLLVLAYGLFQLVIICLLDKPIDEIFKSLKQAPKFMFGKIPEEVDVRYQFTHAEENHARLRKREAKRVRAGSTVLACSFLTQCIGRIVLYARRKAHGAVTLADERIFELGCTGVLTALFWIANALELRPVSEAVPKARTVVGFADKAATFIRNYHAKPLEDGVIQISGIKHGLVCFVLLLVQHKIFYLRILWDAFQDLTGGYMFMLAVMGSVSFLSLFCVIIFWEPGLRIRFKYSRFVTGVFWVVDGCTFASAVLGIVSLLSFGVLNVLGQFVLDCVNIQRQLAKGHDWPTDVACPLLWSDPAASWIWALA